MSKMLLLVMNLFGTLWLMLGIANIMIGKPIIGTIDIAIANIWVAEIISCHVRGD